MAVDDVSFGVERGKILTLLGPSGCGKTTTLRSVAGLEQPEAGLIAIAGEPMTSMRDGIAVRWALVRASPRRCHLSSRRPCHLDPAPARLHLHS
jgi:ABC-type sulfate/molybdate transport systems ATPase subunit